MATCFSAQQECRVDLKGSWDQVQEFLREPRHLTAALLNQGQVRQLDRERFEVRMNWIGALGIQVRPIVDLQIQTSDRGEVYLQAIGCRIEGNDWIDKHFDLAFEGSLRPLEISAQSVNPIAPKVSMCGWARLKVCLELPPLLSLTPPPVVETVGSTIVNGVLMTIRHSLCRQLPQSFLAHIHSSPQRSQGTDPTPTPPYPYLSPHPLSGT